ncbi:MAG: hypothetical protein WBE65_00235 [Steroidobacteraceae bacterium]
MAEIIARGSRRTPVAKTLRLRHSEGENRLTASVRAPKSPPRIHITLNTAMLERMTVKITSFTHSVG